MDGQELGHEVFFHQDPAEQQAARPHGEHADLEGVVVGFLRDLRQRRDGRAAVGAGVLLGERYAEQQEDDPYGQHQPLAIWVVR
jgi:hypothetical protein